MLTGNRTLDLFWRTVEACGIPEKEANEIIRNIERKHGVSIGALEKSHDYRRSNLVYLSREEIEFVEYLKENRLLREFCRENKIEKSTLIKAVQRGRMSIEVYEKFKQAKENFKEVELCLTEKAM